MAIISDANVTSFIRSLIGEEEAKHWTDEEITLYKQFGMIAVNSKYWYLLAPTEAKVAATSLTANTATVSLPTDAAKILRVEVAENRRLLRKIEPDELWKYSVYDDGAAATNYLNIWYLEYYDTVTDFPETLRPLIALEAVMFALSKDKGITAGIKDMHTRFEEIAITFLSTDSMYEPTIFGDDELERQYTESNPCAWSFRDGSIYLYKSYDGEG